MLYVLCVVYSVRGVEGAHAVQQYNEWVLYVICIGLAKTVRRIFERFTVR